MTLVWDRLVRFIHWSVALAVLINFLNESGSAWHRYTGYAAAGLVFLRLAWGIFSHGYARFSNWWPGLSSLPAYVRTVCAGRVPRYLGVNPLGAIMAGSIWMLIIALAVTGWLMETDSFWGEEWLENLHEVFAYVLLACSFLHVIAVFAMSMKHGENLAKAMITGKKSAPSNSATAAISKK